MEFPDEVTGTCDALEQLAAQLSEARVEREETVEVRREKVVKKISCIESPSPRFTLSAFETMFPDKPRQKIVLELCSGQAHFSQMVDADGGA